ncbi:hypothetical protein ABLG04_001234 [Pseudomonas aeruginosa]
MPDMREEFEKWATKHRMPIHRDGVVTDYSARCTDECWQAWQASRAALNVRLPKPYGSSSLDAYSELAEFNRGIMECLAALQQAGIEVK